MNLENLANEIKSLALQEGEVLKNAFMTAISSHIKTNIANGWIDQDVVTDLDRSIEKKFFDRLSTKFPELGFCLEEHPESNDTTKEYVAYIDPIDGTKYFAKGVPVFCISVGIVRNGDPVLGVVYNPMSDQMYVGGEGMPTTLNGKPTSVSNCSTLSKAMISADFASRKENWNTEKEWMIEKTGEIIDQSGKVRLFGAGALSCAWVASGGLDGFVSIWGHGSKPFDIAAGKALIKYSNGGVIKEVHVPGLPTPRLVGGNQKIADEIERILLDDSQK